MELQEAPPAGRVRGRRTGMERFLVGLTVFLLLSSVALVAALVYVVTAEDAPASAASVTASASPANRSQRGETSRRTMDTAAKQELCLTPGCVKLASDLLRFRDNAVDPCDDFYQHACGAWERRVLQIGITDSETDFSYNYDQMQRVIDWKLKKLLTSSEFASVPSFKTAQKFFSFCVEHVPRPMQKLRPSADHIVEHVLGGFVSQHRWAERPVKLTSLMIKLFKLLATPLVDVNPDVNPYNKTQRAIQASLPNFDPLENSGRRMRPWQRGPLGKTWFRRRSGGLRGPRRVDSAIEPPPPTSAQPPEPSGSDSAESPQPSGSDSGSGLPPPTESDQEPDSADEPTDSSQFLSLLETSSFEDQRQGMLEYFRAHVSAKNQSSMLRDIPDLSKFITSLYSITPSRRKKAEAEISSHLKYRHVMTVYDLQSNYSFVNWSRLLSEVLLTEVTGSDTAYVIFPGYMTDLDVLLDMFPSRIVHNALLLIFRKFELESVIKEMAAASESEDQMQQGCYELTRDTFPVAMAGMFVRDAGQTRVEELKAKVTSILTEIRVELKRSIEQKAATAPSPIHELALNKLQNLRMLLVSSDSFWDDQFIAENTPNIQRLIKAEDPEQEDQSRLDRHRLLRLIRAMSNVQKFNLRKIWEAGGGFNEDFIWTQQIQTFTPNAFYLPAYNSIVVPLGLLAVPYVYENVPRYVSYSSLGTTLGHELMHTLGITGLSYDANGVLRRPSDSEKQQLRKLRRCVRHHYLDDLGRVVLLGGVPWAVQLDRDLTLEENLADHDSLTLTWRAYKREQRGREPEPSLPGIEMTAKQVFILNLAQGYCTYITPAAYIIATGTTSHSTNPERVNAMLRHWPGFSEAFSCPPGSRMHPEKQCKPLW